MDNDAIDRVPGADGVVMQPGQPGVVPPPAPAQQAAPLLSRRQEDLVPEVFVVPQPIASHNNYKEVFSALYGTLAVKAEANDDNNETRFIQTEFLSLNNQQFDNFKAQNVMLSSLNRDHHSLYKLLCMVNTPGRGQQFNPLLALMNNNEVNNVLSTSTEHDLDANDEHHPLLVFRIWVRTAMAALDYQRKKARAAICLYARIESLGGNVLELRNKYQRLLASLTNRGEVNAFALHVAQELQGCIDDTLTYLAINDQQHIQNIPLAIDGFRELDDFSITGVPDGLYDIAARDAFWQYHHHVVNFNCLVTAPFNQHSNTIEPILTGIRNFSMSPREEALERASNLRPSAAKLKEDIVRFLSTPEEQRSLGAAKTFRSTLGSMKQMLESLLPHGVLLSSESTGLSGAEMMDFSSELDDFISKKESLLRKEEAAARLEKQELSKSTPQLKLPPLHGFQSYLSWKSAADVLLPLHQSDLIKKQLVRNSLKNQDDLMRTVDLDFSSILGYLEKRYASPLLIPALVESLTRMKKAYDDKSSYDNLTVFVSLLNQLRAHNAEDRLDYNTRQKLAPILLHGTNLTMFFRDLQKKEKELKSREAEEDDVPDHASILSHAMGERFEKERREFWIEECMTYLDVVRRLVSSNASSSSDRKTRGNASKNYSTNPSGGCPVCHGTHRNDRGEVVTSLAKCERFKNEFSPKQRIKKVEQLNFCKRCLKSKADISHNNEGGRGCRLADQNNWTCNKCSPPSRTHHSLLHDPDLLRPSGPSRDSPGRGGGTGRGRGRGAGGSRNSSSRGRGKGRGGSSASHSTSHSSENGNNNQGSASDYVDQHLSGCPEDATETVSSHLPGPEEEGDHHAYLAEPELDAAAPGDLHPGPFTPISKESLMTNISCYQTKNIKRFSLDSSRIFLTCCSFVTMKVTGGEARGVALLDVGSSLGYISIPFAKKNKLKQEGVWKGKVSTIHGTKESRHPIYVAHLVDIHNKVHTARFLGTERIGHKQGLPHQLFVDLCKDFKISQASFQNVEGPIQILVGLDTCHLLADKHIDLSIPKYPELFVCSSLLSSQYIFCGAIGKDLLDSKLVQTLTFKTDILCFHTSAVSTTRHPDTVSITYDENDKTEHRESGWMWSLVSAPVKRLWAFTTALTSRLRRVSPSFSQQDEGHIKIRVHFDDVPDQEAHEDAPDSCSSFLVKPSAAHNNISDAAPAPSLHCPDCIARINSCKTCKYINSEISIHELKQLELLRNSIQIIDDPHGSGGKRLLCNYPLTVIPEEAFHARFSNVNIARRNSERLRERVIRLGLGKQFHQEMLKVLENKHIRIVENFDPAMSPHSFIFLNYTLKNSLSQPIRPVSNSGATNLRGFSINNCSFSGPNYISSGLQCLLGFRFYGGAGFCSDLTRAYRTLMTPDLINNLRMFWWYVDIDKPESACVFQFTRVTFGDRPASCLLELALRDYLAPLAKTPEVRYTTQSARLVDDFVNSTPNPDRLPLIRDDLFQMAGHYGFIVKHFYHSGQPDPDEGPISVLGLNWHCKEDVLSLQTSFYPGVKRRGKQTGKELCDTDISSLVLTKTILSRILGQAFSYDGMLLSPLRTSLSILFSKACQTLKSWDVPLRSTDPSLDSEARILLKNISRARYEIKPVLRGLIPAGNVLKKIIVSTDSSCHCLGFLIYFVSQAEDGSMLSRLVISKPKIHSLTVPQGELEAITRGVKFATTDLLTLLPALKTFIKQNKVKMIIATDSLCSASTLSPFKIHKDVRARNCVHSVHRYCTEIVQVNKNIEVMFTHQSSNHVPADQITKMCLDPIPLCNGDFYRMGHPAWLEENWPSQVSIFLHFKHNTDVSFTKPRAEQDINSEVLCIRCLGSNDFCYPEDVSAASPALLVHPEGKLQPPSSQEVISTTGHLDKDSYNRLISNSRSLIKVLCVIKRILMLFKSKQCTLKQSFKILIKSHQNLFTADRVRSLYPVTDHSGLLCVTTRLSSEDGAIMEMCHRPYIVSHHDRRLTFLMIQNAHISTVRLAMPAHLGPVYTLARLRQGDYAIHLTRAAQETKTFISKCAICLRVKGKPQDVGLGSPRFIKHLRQVDTIFSLCSTDQIGPYLKSPFCGSRKSIKYFILIIACILSGALSAELMEDNSRQSVLCALFLHSQRHTRPRVLYCDRGSSINPQPGSNLYKHYFGEHPMEVIQCEASHQKLNYAERKIAELKKLLKTSLLARETLHMPNLNYMQIRATLSSVCTLLNSQPIVSPLIGSVIISPQHLIKPNWLLSDDEADILSSPSAIELQSNLQLIRDQMAAAHQIFTKILKTSLISATRRSLRQHSSANPFQIGDLALSLKSNSYNLCKIIQLFPQHCQVLSAEKNPPVLKNVHCSLLVLIFRPQTSPSQLTAAGSGGGGGGPGSAPGLTRPCAPDTESEPELITTQLIGQHQQSLGQPEYYINATDEYSSQNIHMSGCFSNSSVIPSAPTTQDQIGPCHGDMSVMDYGASTRPIPAHWSALAITAVPSMILQHMHHKYRRAQNHDAFIRTFLIPPEASLL